MNTHDLPTPALLIDVDALDHNLATMAAARPGAQLRPHVKAHKCTALAAAQAAVGHTAFTCATPREVLGMAAAGLGADLLLANETIDPRRLAAMAAAGDDARITVAVDSADTIDAAATAGIREVVIDVDIGLPRCGCAPDEAAHLADLARSRGLNVRGTMGYEGHLMALLDRHAQRLRVEAAIEVLLGAHEQVGGELVSSGGTGTYDIHPASIEVQAGSYVLMDTHYARLHLPFRQACVVLGTVIAAGPTHAVADVGLKALGMDHGNPSIDLADVSFCSDEHITFVPHVGVASVGERVEVIPAHIDPTMAMHAAAWLVRGTDVLDRWPIDLRGW
ncbi:MAG: putative amino acid aldolase or racemase [Ilumatobacteraceae bacterium]|nr:putative amino acid aldolase or racemase [Ilumatobacteraceae bacterium]